MKAERFTGAVFICVIMLFMCLAVSEFTVRQARKLPYFKPASETVRKSIIINWEKLYPFSDGKIHTLPEKVETLRELVKRKFEEYTTKYIAGYYSIVEAAKKYEDIMRWNVAVVSGYNPVIKLHDGYLTSFTRSRDVTADAESVKRFADFCKGAGVEFMYINLPVKICPSEDKDISGILDFKNQNADKFLSLMKEAGVKYYDFRNIFHDTWKNHHEAFYTTDHHWKAETGLWAAGQVLKILRDDYGWPVKPENTAPEKFKYVKYPEWFLGSEGKKITLARTKADDFTMIYPEYPVEIHCEILAESIDITGNFSITYNMSQVASKDYYGLSPYHAYSYGDQALIKIKNMLTDDGIKILLIHDSFSDSVIPFLALGIQHTYAIDMRHFTGSIKKFIEMEKPNAVIVMNISSQLARKPNFYEAREMFDMN